ncbi:MAG: NADH-quinone oxidoreductase subunit C [Candidatus Sedimenticola sp. 6PFRAG7]
MNDTVKSMSEERHETLVENLKEQFEAKGCSVTYALGEVTMVVPRQELSRIARTLRDGEDFLFDELIDACGVDYSTFGQSEWITAGASATGFGRGVSSITAEMGEGAERFAAVYHLLSVANNQRLRIRVFVDSEHPIVDSLCDVWSAADWFEREAFDMYGILFDGHPDLRRILTDYGFLGHPFRKDFPLEGNVEMRYDPEQQRVIYEPIKLDSRTLVPKVIREDGSSQDEQTEPSDA